MSFSAKNSTSCSNFLGQNRRIAWQRQAVVGTAGFGVKALLAKGHVLKKFLAVGGMAANLTHQQLGHTKAKQGGNGGAAHGVAANHIAKTVLFFALVFQLGVGLAAFLPCAGKCVYPAGFFGNKLKLLVKVKLAYYRQQFCFIAPVLLYYINRILRQQYAGVGIGFLAAYFKVPAGGLLLNIGRGKAA